MLWVAGEEPCVSECFAGGREGEGVRLGVEGLGFFVVARLEAPGGGLLEMGGRLAEPSGLSLITFLLKGHGFVRHSVGRPVQGGTERPI